MESVEALNQVEAKKAERKQALTVWLAESGFKDFSLKPMAGDASFRRYFRVTTPSQTYVAMDAPPPTENCRPFVAIAKSLSHYGLNAPQIIKMDLDNGFLLLSDFGDTTYLAALNPTNANQLYHHALDTLVILQACREVKDHPIPPFTRDFMLKEWAWHKEWFLSKLLKLDFEAYEKALDQCYEQLVVSATSQPQVMMHRDYHAGNLMVVNNETLGILDFQDAFWGPITYDPVSLLRDCYIDWPEEQVQAWAKYYFYELQRSGYILEVEEQQFLRWFDWMGVQRHLKALLTFARKDVRDSQPSYLKFIPRTLHYLITVTHHYHELTLLHDYLRNIVLPAFESAYPCVR